MKLVGRLGGVGKIVVNLYEDQQLQKLKELVSFKHGDAVSIPEYMPEKRQHFKEIMKELFPTFPLEEKNLRVFGRFGDAIVSGETVIDSYFPTFKEGARQSAELRITSINDRNYFMTVALMNYHPSCVDDLIEILGERTDPRIKAPQYLSNGWYGVSEVPHLDKVFEIYESATHLFENAEDLIGISQDELNVLRRDKDKHENIAIRKLSSDYYQKALGDLTNQ